MTRWESVIKSLHRLVDHGLTPNKMIEIPTEELEELLKGVRFHRRKVEFIKRSSEMVLSEYNGEVPQELDDILKFPGIGTPMGLSLQQYVFNKVGGIIVDSHSLRVANRLKWADSKGIETTRKQLESWLPKDKWLDSYALLLAHGIEVCKPTSPL